MHSSLWFLYLLIVVLVLCLSVCLYYLVKFARIILDLEDALEDSLDVLNERYGAMSQILQKPIFFDSLEVRQCVNEIKKSRAAILYVANVLTNPIKKESYLESLNEQIQDKED